MIRRQCLPETGYKQITENCMTTGFTEFERMCDDYLMSYVKDAKYKTLTPEPLVGYISRKRNGNQMRKNNNDMQA